MTGSDRKPLPDMFAGYVETLIEDEGIGRFWPAISLDAEEKLSVYAIDGGPDMVFMVLLKAMLEPQTRELIFCLDRYVKPGQPGEFKDLLTLGHWTRTPGPAASPLSGTWHFGVINYQPTPRIVRPIDWNNAFWNAIARGEVMSRLRPPSTHPTHRPAAGRVH